MKEPMTLGEMCDTHGYAEVMLKVGELAQALGRIPVGEWDYRFTTDPQWRVCVNGGQSAEWTPPEAPAVPRYHALFEYNGWFAGLVNPAEGTMLAGMEARAIAAIEQEIRAVSQ